MSFKMCAIRVLALLCLAGCWQDVPPDRVFKSAGRDVEVYSSFEKIAMREKFARIIPSGATDIWITWGGGIGGQDVDFRCRISLDDLLSFAKERGYKFEEFDMNDNAMHGFGFCLRNPESAIFAHFPLVVDAEVLGHHSDGFLGFSANDEQKKRVDADWLKYVYDVKFGVLWGMWYN